MIYRSTTSSLLAVSIVLAVCCSSYVGRPSFAQTKRPSTGRTRPAPRPTPTPAAGTKQLTQPGETKAEATEPAAPTPEPVEPVATRPTPRPAASAPAPQPNKRKLVMVPDFDSQGLPNWWGTWNIGSLFGNVMVSHLSRTDAYGVVERERMREILAELDTSGTEQYKQERFTKAGKLLGADYILFGYLTNFSRKKSSKFLYEEYSAGISFNVRLVDIASGRVVKSAEVEYVSPKDKKVSLSGKNELNPNDPDFLQSLFGKAINESVRQAVTNLTGGTDPALAQGSGGSTVGGGGNGASPVHVSEPVPSGPVKGMIAAIDGDTIIINRGQSHGVKVGSHFVISKVVREIRDPETNKVIRQQTEEMARIKVTKIEAASCDGVLVSSKVKLNVKDAVTMVD
ncbi:MAG TPA: CsgG/HfaB family protein [Pyrinomonadaceae bacterium]